MARDIDILISHVKQLDWPATMKQIIVNRLEPNPTPEEIERAARMIYLINNCVETNRPHVISFSSDEREA